MDTYRTTMGYSGMSVVVISLVVGLLGMVGGYVLATQMPWSTVSTMSTSTGDRITGNTVVPANQNGMVENSEEVAFTIEVSTLPEAQQTALRTMGFDSNSIAVTKGTVACVESSIGAERTRAIQGGAAPTASEGVTIMTCYTANQ